MGNMQLQIYVEMRCDMIVYNEDLLILNAYLLGFPFHILIPF